MALLCMLIVANPLALGLPPMMAADGMLNASYCVVGLHKNYQ